MNKTLSTIQTLAKVTKIISKILFILGIIGSVGLLLGIVSLAFASPDVLMKIGGVSVYGLLGPEAAAVPKTAYAAMAAAFVECVCATVLAKFAERCFQKQCEVGTPFTFDCANEYKRLGILTLCLSLGGAFVAGIIYAIVLAVLGETGSYENALGGEVVSGVMFLVLSLVFRYGAETFAAAPAPAPWQVAAPAVGAPVQPAAPPMAAPVPEIPPEAQP